MRLASIRPGDIVRVDGSLAEVVAKAPDRLTIRWAGRPTNLRTIGARSVEVAWHRLSGGQHEDEQER